MKKDIKKELIHKIEIKLQVVVKGYDTCRPAIINLSDLNLPLTCKNGEVVTVETAQCFQYVTVITNGKRGWCEYEKMDKEEIEMLLKAIDLQLLKEKQSPGKYIRAYNPWWFLGKNSNEVLDNIINESAEDYLKSIGRQS